MNYTKWIFLVFFLFANGAWADDKSCWDKAAEGNNAFWVIAKSIVSPFICIPADIIAQDYTYTGTDPRSIYTVTTQSGTTTYIVTPRSSGADITVVK